MASLSISGLALPHCASILREKQRICPGNCSTSGGMSSGGLCSSGLSSAARRGGLHTTHRNFSGAASRQQYWRPMPRTTTTMMLGGSFDPFRDKRLPRGGHFLGQPFQSMAPSFHPGTDLPALGSEPRRKQSFKLGRIGVKRDDDSDKSYETTKKEMTKAAKRLREESKGGTGRIAVYFVTWWGLNIIFNVYNKKVLNVYPFPWLTSVMALFAGTVIMLGSWMTGCIQAPDTDMQFWQNLFPLASSRLSGGASAFHRTRRGDDQHGEERRRVHADYQERRAGFQRRLIAALPGREVSSSGLLIALAGCGRLLLVRGHRAQLRYDRFPGSQHLQRCLRLPQLLLQERHEQKSERAQLLRLPLHHVTGNPDAVRDRHRRLSQLDSWLANRVPGNRPPIPLVGSFTPRLDLCFLMRVLVPRETRWVIAQSVFYHLYNQVSYMSLDQISPLTFSIGNTMKRVSVIAASILIFKTPVQPVNLIGASIAIFGTFLYSQVVLLCLDWISIWIVLLSTAIDPLIVQCRRL